MQQRRQSISGTTPIRGAQGLLVGATPPPSAGGPPDTPLGMDCRLGTPPEDETLADDEQFVVEEHAHRCDLRNEGHMRGTVIDGHDKHYRILAVLSYSRNWTPV